MSEGKPADTAAVSASALWNTAAHQPSKEHAAAFGFLFREC